jgi:hypothetical protein
MQAAYGDTAAFRAGLARQAAMYLQQTSHSMQEELPTPAQMETEAASDAWIEVAKPLQFLVVESQACCSNPRPKSSHLSRTHYKSTMRYH